MDTFRAKRRINNVIARQHGLITRDQAISYGATASTIHNLLKSNTWIKVNAGVYRLAAVAPTWHQSLLAACFRSSGKTWICGRSAAAFWTLDGFEPNLVEVCTVRNFKSKDGSIVHRIPDMPPAHITNVKGIPLTTVHRTLADLGSVVEPHLVEAALECALRRRITTIDRLWGIIGELGRRGRRGPSVLARLLEAHDGRPTDSALETRCAQLLRKHGLPNPTRQVRIRDENGFLARVDFLYEQSGVVIEVDGRSHHVRRDQWATDLQRQNALTSKGLKVFRLTHEQIAANHPTSVIGIKEVLEPRLPGA
jgi:very-short-patch-repair endonuclease